MAGQVEIISVVTGEAVGGRGCAGVARVGAVVGQTGGPRECVVDDACGAGCDGGGALGAGRSAGIASNAV